MRVSKTVAVLSLIALSACAQQPAKQPKAVLPVLHIAEAGSSTMHGAAKKADTADATLPKEALTDRILFQTLLGEIALQRGQSQVAISTYLDLARETRDPRIAQRATEIAWSAQDTDAALDAAMLWEQTAPDSRQARQIVAALLISQSRLDEARPRLEQWLKDDPKQTGRSFLQLSGLVAHDSDRGGVLKLMQTLAVPYPKVPEAHLAVAQAALNDGKTGLALKESRRALELRPDWDTAVLFQAQVLQQRSPDAALHYLHDYLEQHPHAKTVRLAYARLLVTDRQYPQARNEFRTLLADHPDNPEITMALGLLSLQLKDYDDADANFRRALTNGFKDTDAVKLYLGEVDDARGRPQDAIEWYESVSPGRHYIPARARVARIMAKQGKLDAARRYLQATPVSDTMQRVLVVQAESSLLRENKQYEAAYDVLDAALKKRPNNADLLYDHAMAAEQINRLDVMEANLRRLIKLRPNYAQAYNALGYTYADRDERLPEARKLIAKALKLAPNDPFIMDSMGWVLYRMGKIDDSYGYLSRAFALQPDPEIAAHLGEVLWHQGKHADARKVWRTALQDHPDNEVLQKTVKRFVR
ncbi:MAG TPA: tetratricopeptide repeat protein [Burkholderiales bacterium]|jgi:tetratricopeptide (TPR) repeat protein|nr:tetratricopeptide repeat protein [Burkholderiales bacterium]